MSMMMTDLAVVETPAVDYPIAHMPRVGPRDLFAALLADARSPNTATGRDHDCRSFARFLGQADPTAALALFISGSRANACAIALAYRRFETDRGCQAATVNRRLATLRRAVRLATRFDVVDWGSIDVDDLRITGFRDCRGPDAESWRALWSYLVAAGDGPQARRNRALIRLLYDSALRKSECIGLDFPADLDLAGARVAIKGKGYTDKVWVTISATCVRLLREWLSARGDRPGAVFISHARRDATADAALMAVVTELRDTGLEWADVAKRLNSRGKRTVTGRPWNAQRLLHFVHDELVAELKRMPEREVNRLLDGLSEKVGLARAIRPHGLRHAAITRALDLTNGDVRRVSRYARHASVAVTMRYDDSRIDHAGEITLLVSADSC